MENIVGEGEMLVRKQYEKKDIQVSNILVNISKQEDIVSSGP